MNAQPPLLALAEGRRVRQRKAPVWRAKESELQIDVANTLRAHCLKDWRWTHFPAGVNLPVIAATQLKRFGLNRGWSDFVLVSPSAVLHALELKRIGGKLSDDQKAFQSWCLEHGAPYAVAYDLREALAALDDWGCLRIRP